MAGVDIRNTAQAIATALEELGPISKIYPYPRPQSAVSNGEGCLMFNAGTIPAGPDGVSQGGQMVFWQLLLRIDAPLTDIDFGVSLDKTVTDLCSADPNISIIGKLWDNRSLDIYGYPRVTDEGCSVSYDQETDQTLITTISCMIGAVVDVGG